MFDDEDFKNATDEECRYMQGQNAAMDDPYYKNWGDADDHGWTPDEIQSYEDWLYYCMPNHD